MARTKGALHALRQRHLWGFSLLLLLLFSIPALSGSNKGQDLRATLNQRASVYKKSEHAAPYPIAAAEHSGAKGPATAAVAPADAAAAETQVSNNGHSAQKGDGATPEGASDAGAFLVERSGALASSSEQAAAAAAARAAESAAAAVGSPSEKKAAGIPPVAGGVDSRPPKEGSSEEEGKQGPPSPQLENAPPGVMPKPRPISAPFVVHYSKHMAILWEWYTKTIGATMNGKRRQDEDALVVHAPARLKPNVRFKAIFDGHGGSAVSRTCVAQFCNFFGNMADLSPRTFKKTSLLLDGMIRADPVRHERGGSTGLVVAIERPDDKIPKFIIHVSNIGDSRAFLLHRNGTYTIMSKDHKPSDPEEVARINRAGGFVSRVRKVFRVDGTLSLSRAFGDIRMKANPNLPATEQKVVAVPDVLTFEASEGDYIFMACDGMFEAPGMTWDYVANLLHRELESTNDNLVETAFRMLNVAYLLGSADNISIVLTKLMDRKRSSSVVKRFTYDFSGKREFIDTQVLKSPNEYRSGTYHTTAGPVVTLF